MNVLVTLAALVSVAGSGPSVPTFTDEARGFSIAIPPGWSVISTDNDVTVLKMTREDGFGSNFNMRIQQGIPAINSGELEWKTFVDMVEQGAVRRIPDYKVLKSTPMRHGEHTAALVLAQGSQEGTKFRNLQYYLSTPDHFYIMTWTCGEKGFDAQIEGWQAACRSFKVLK